MAGGDGKSQEIQGQLDRIMSSSELLLRVKASPREGKRARSPAPADGGQTPRVRATEAESEWQRAPCGQMTPRAGLEPQESAVPRPVTLQGTVASCQCFPSILIIRSLLKFLIGA